MDEKKDGILAGLGLSESDKKSDLAAEVEDRLHGKMGDPKQQVGAAKEIIGLAG